VQLISRYLLYIIAHSTCAYKKGGGKSKGNPVTCHWRHRGGSRYTAVPMPNLGIRWKWVSTPRPGRLNLRKETG